MKKPYTVLLAMLVGSAAQAQESAFVEGNTILTLGSYDLNQGQPDRDVFGAQGNYFRNDGLGLHFDIAGLSSDVEDTAYLGFGVSTEIGPDLRAKAMIGGSGSDFGYFPEVFVDGELEKDFGSDRGIVLRGGLSYSKYNSNTEEARLRGQAVRYGKPNAGGGYFVQQAELSVASSLDSGTTGGEASAAFTYISQQGWNAGLGIAAGRIAYDQQLGEAVENDFWAVRPNLGYRVSNRAEVFLRAEYVDTELYDLRGVTLGLNFSLN